jgi:hypothetical protein
MKMQDAGPVNAGRSLCTIPDLCEAIFSDRQELMSTHRIRLAGPWQLIPADAASVQQRSSVKLSRQDEVRTDLPCDIPSALAEQGASLLCRRFHCPNGLEPQTAVDLVLTTDTAEIQLTLNGNTLSGTGTEITPEAEITPEDSLRPDHQAPPTSFRLSYSIRHLLQPFNELRIADNRPATDIRRPAVLFSAALEISETFNK